jgi:hypothetical protein
MGHQLAEAIEVLRREGEVDRRRVAQLTAQLQTTETQLKGVMEMVSQLTQELKEQRRSSTIWQEKATKQMQDNARATTAQTEMILAELQALRQLTRIEDTEAGPADMGSPKKHRSKKRKAKGSVTAPTGVAGPQQDINRFGALDEGDEDDDCDMEEEAEGNNDGQPLIGEAPELAGGPHGAVMAGSSLTGLSGQQHQQPATSERRESSCPFGADAGTCEATAASQTAASQLSSNSTPYGITPQGYIHNPLPPQPSGQVEGESH